MDSSAVTPKEKRRIRVLRTVWGDWPIGHMYSVHPGVYTPEVNQHGAVSVRTPDGTLLGLKPDEFEPEVRDVQPKKGEGKWIREN